MMRGHTLLTNDLSFWTRAMSQSIDPLTHSAADLEATTGGQENVSIMTQSDPAPQRYLLGEEIARGGMGEVYRATDTVLNREVAVKVLQTKFAPDSGTARRFADEGRITGQLQHPNIPAVHDLGILPDGRPFLAMKLIKGETLDELLKQRTSIEQDRGLFIAVFEQICQAVAYAHAHDVIHRDLKPQNVMVGAFSEVQVMDWGLAKVLTNRGRDGGAADPEATTAPTEVVSLRDSDGSFTQAGSILGTPAFMPPEQAVGAVSSIDARSDVFGLGAILAVILTGRPPFVSTSPETTRVKAAQGDVAECFAKLDGCGAEPELIALCKCCLSPKQNDRPTNAEEVAIAVAEHRAAAAERARQAELDSVKSAEKRKRRRTQFVLAAVGIVLLAAIGVGSVLASLWRNAEEAKSKALAAQEETEAARERLARVEYGRTMQVAYQEYRENNVGAARKLLESTRPDLRGWEYHHVHRLCHAELLTLKGSTWKPDVSPDGKRILAVDAEEKKARLFDTETGKELLVISDVPSATLSKDGNRIAVSSKAGIRILDARTGDILRTILVHSEDGALLEFSPDGKWLAADDAETMIWLWDVGTGTEILKVKIPPNERACLTFSPDSTRVVFAEGNQRISIRECTSGKELLSCPAGKGEIYILKYSPDGTRIATAGRERTVRVWDAQTGAPEHVLKVESGGSDLSFSPDGRILAAGSLWMDTPPCGTCPPAVGCRPCVGTPAEYRQSLSITRAPG
jgi:serine/threonine protein kinase